MKILGRQTWAKLTSEDQKQKVSFQIFADFTLTLSFFVQISSEEQKKVVLYFKVSSRSRCCNTFLCSLETADQANRKFFKDKKSLIKPLYGSLLISPKVIWISDSTLDACAIFLCMENRYGIQLNKKFNE